MKILTDDPDWKRDLYEARALAIKFVGRQGRLVEGGHRAVRNGLTVTYHPDRSPMQLTISVRPLAIPAQGGGASAPMA